MFDGHEVQTRSMDRVGVDPLFPAVHFVHGVQEVPLNVLDD